MFLPLHMLNEADMVPSNQIPILSTQAFTLKSLFPATITAQKVKFFVKDFPTQFPADLVTFAEEVLNGKLDFLCSVCFASSRQL